MNTNIEKYKIFFKDLIVLARETIFINENNINIPLVYIIFLNNDKNKWFHFYYDIKIKKWIISTYKNPNLLIFNPKVKSGISDFLEKFDIEDIKIANIKINKIYELYKYKNT